MEKMSNFEGRQYMKNDLKELIKVFQKESKELEEVKEFFDKENRERNTKGGWISWWLKRSVSNIKSVLGMYKFLGALVILVLGKVGYDVYTHKTLSPEYVAIAGACTILVLYIVSMIITYLNLTMIGHVDAHLDKYKSSKKMEYNLYIQLLKMREEMTIEKVNAITESIYVEMNSVDRLKEEQRQELNDIKEELRLTVQKQMEQELHFDNQVSTLESIIDLINEKHASINIGTFNLKEFSFANSFTLYKKEGKHLFNVERYKVNITDFPLILSLEDTDFSMVNAISTTEKTLVEMKSGKQVVYSFKVTINNDDYVYSFHFSKYDTTALSDFLLEGEHILLLDAIKIILERLENHGLLVYNVGKGGVRYASSGRKSTENKNNRKEKFETNSKRENSKTIRK